MGTPSALPLVFSFRIAFGLAGGAGSPPRRDWTKKTGVSIFCRKWGDGELAALCCPVAKTAVSVWPPCSCARSEAGVLRQPSPQRGYPCEQLQAMLGEAAGCQLHSSALERGDFSCTVGVSEKGWWQKKAAKSLVSSASPLTLPGGGKGAHPAHSLKTSRRWQQGNRPVASG